MAELLLAIKHVHTHNIIHRDIKQDNIFINADGHIALGDLSDTWQDCAPETHLTRGRVGTRASSSSEIPFDHEYGLEIDLWALGVILYKLLTCKSQLTTGDTADLLLRRDRDSCLSGITEIEKHLFLE